MFSKKTNTITPVNNISTKRTYVIQKKVNYRWKATGSKWIDVCIPSTSHDYIKRDFKEWSKNFTENKYRLVERITYTTFIDKEIR